jgi:hypothetical protein
LMWSPLLGTALLALVPVLFAVASEGFEQSPRPTSPPGRTSSRATRWLGSAARVAGWRSGHVHRWALLVRAGVVGVLGVVGRSPRSPARARWRQVAGA